MEGSNATDDVAIIATLSIFFHTLYYALSLSLSHFSIHFSYKFSHHSISLSSFDMLWYSKQFAMKNWHTRHNNMKIIKRKIKRRKKCATYNICAFGSEERKKIIHQKHFLPTQKKSKKKSWRKERNKGRKMERRREKERAIFFSFC